MNIFRTIFSLIITAWIVPLASSKESIPDGGQTISGSFKLNSTNFDVSIRDGSVWLIEFMAPWCTHCRKFEMEYESVAFAVHGRNNKKDRKVKVGKVDGDAERAIANRFGIRSFPCFFLIDGLSVYEYEGTRSKDELVKYVTTDYKADEPLSFLMSPMGPMGQLQALLMIIGNAGSALFVWAQKITGFSPVVTGILVAGGALSSFLFGLIVVVIIVTSKDKED
mmetsp:Transcript_6650/g.8092  ORF Transcript_6650/g.8092 Transcript_6650/m.8092 type:complete len:223 (+) Transcript_6650:24-692(+)|eukprot:CAMPEP_0195251144 /NCGR_PEP_ID=MMETSP0706-20130129/3113_1 /TAXON_ID=33640 /ORGANISM="Asterionellopsis glacialis, Strain CCMP134" /LENGTH=222 /DNA_ID=CAMNT_0040303235 /DNA_START=59 /DNA_END=727 /DNA_ORIENTATION=-